MSKELKVDEIIKPMTAVEFDAFLKEYKQQNPQKFAIKMANGEFDRYRKTLEGNNVVPTEESEVRRGRPRSKE